MVWAPARIAASTQRRSTSRSVRLASWADHSTSPQRLRARVTEPVTASITSSGDMRRMWLRCEGLVEMKVWMRPRLAPRTASPARSISAGLARARPQTMDSVMMAETFCTDSKSPLEAIGKPASITSTFMSSRILANSSFSSSDMEAPGDCSPSRMVVSKMMTRSLGFASAGTAAALASAAAVGSVVMGGGSSAGFLMGG
jgi:hypothetical protein